MNIHRPGRSETPGTKKHFLSQRTGGIFGGDGWRSAGGKTRALLQNLQLDVKVQ